MSIKLGIIASSRGTAAPPVGLLLDTYPGATAAYSFRKLRSAYTGYCIEARNNNGTLNIGFVNNVLDTATLLTFAGSQGAIVSKFYDQSGNGNTANAGGGAGVRIVNIGGTLVTDGGKVACASLGTYFFLTSNITLNSNYSCYSVFTRVGNGNAASFGTDTNDFAYINLLDGTNVLSHNTVNRSIYSFTATGRRLFTTLNISNNLTMLNNAVVQSTTTTLQNATMVFKNVCAWPSYGYGSSSIFQEHILYNTNQSANNNGIQNNINSFYTIY